jgi:transcription-repair coupling factor (superfamily II helicase)
MERFAEGETLILLCTSIVESGLDIRRVNTIIVEDIHLFGLAQLYQVENRHQFIHSFIEVPHPAVLARKSMF